MSKAQRPKKPRRYIKNIVIRDNWKKFIEEFEKEYEKSPHEKGTHTGDSLKDMCIIAH